MALSICNTAAVLDETGKEVVQRGTPLFPASCFLDNVTKTPVPLHWHDDLEFFVVVSGCAKAVVGADQLLLHKGESIFINAEILHSVTGCSKDPCVLKSVCWHPYLTGGREDSIFWQKYTKPLIENKSLDYIKISGDSREENKVQALFLDAWQQCVREPAGYEVEVRYALSKLLVHLQEQGNICDRHRNEKSIRDEKRLKQMLSLIHLHYNENLTAKAIAGAASISISEAIRCFKATLGTTPIQYVKKFRLEKALSYLSDDLTISEIGNLCGFDDLSYFGKEFKKMYGTSPSEWRKRQRTEQAHSTQNN